MNWVHSFGLSRSAEKVGLLSLLGILLCLGEIVKNLGVSFGADFSFADHM